jgi:hypothetical protein
MAGARASLAFCAFLVIGWPGQAGSFSAPGQGKEGQLEPPRAGLTPHEGEGGPRRAGGTGPARGNER